MTGIEFGLLGPLVVRCGEALVPIQSGKQRAVLATLLLRVGRLVTVGELAEALWGPKPPPSARATLQNYVMRLRKTLPAAGPGLITTQPGGYLISLGESDLDVSLFEKLLAEARAAARRGAWETVAARSGEALALWRGEPLADAGSEYLAAGEGPRLLEMRLQAFEARAQAALHVGREAEAIAELRPLIHAHPLRESFYAQLMTALYRCGRRAEALDVYRRARRVLADELGTEPEAGLRHLYQRMLADDPGLAAADPAAPAARTGQCAHQPLALWLALALVTQALDAARTNAGHQAGRALVATAEGRHEDQVRL